MPCELSAVIEGDRLTPLWMQSSQYRCHSSDGVCGGLRAMIRREWRSWRVRTALSVLNRPPSVLGSAGHSPPGGVLQEGGGERRMRLGSLPTTPPPTFRLAEGQVLTPGVVLLPRQLGVYEPVDGLVGDDPLARLQGQAPGHLLWRPALFETGEDLVPQSAVTLQPGATPATGVGLLVGVHRLVWVREPFRFNSLATVDGERSTLAAILRTLCPAARRQAISHRSSMVTCIFFA